MYAKHKSPNLVLLITASTFCSLFFFFNDTATTEIYTLSLHDALPICLDVVVRRHRANGDFVALLTNVAKIRNRSEEHTSELQSQSNLVCRLLLEKKKHIILLC